MRGLAALDRKVLRDLTRLRGQVAAIALILGSGVGVLLMSLIAMQSLEVSAGTYYERYRFADVFASIERAPRPVERRIAAIPGVQLVETRIVKLATLDVAGFEEPVIGALVSVPERREPLLNRLALRAGRNIVPGQDDEVLISEPFAQAHRLAPGDSITALINGRKRRLEIVGVALSPEFVYAIGPGALMPDNARYGVVWMSMAALRAAYDLEGAFNDVTLALSPDADPQAVIAALDVILEPYGGQGAYARDEQISNWFLMNEIAQLRQFARILPAIFFAVAAFLVSIVLARLIALERGEIGLLKAFGYGNRAVAWHYVKFAVPIALGGFLIGWAAGAWLGHWSARMYADFYRFPSMYFSVGARPLALAAFLSLLTVLVGAIGAARRAAALAPAEAMRPPAPPAFRHRVRGLLPAALLDQPTRMIVRYLARWPLRSVLTAVGIGTAVGLMILALQWLDAIDFLGEDFFFRQQRQDLTLALADTENDDIVRALGALPGILAVEPQRVVAARIRKDHRSRREPLIGLPAAGGFTNLEDRTGQAVVIPPDGLLLSAKLADILQARVGYYVTVEVMEGRRPDLVIPVAGVFETLIGRSAYIDLAALNRRLRDPPSVNRVLAAVDPRFHAPLFRELKGTPAISAVMLRRAALDTFRTTLGDTILIYVSFYVVFAGTLAFGVVYNSVRITLSERARELATLRVLGFRVAEVSYILIGETAALVFMGLPIGCALGVGLSWLMTATFDTELFRVPVVIEPTTYAWAILVCVGAAIGSALLVRARLDRLDLVAVLKARE